MTTAEQQHIFFLGIGGIGMSALARYYLLQGHKVSGYDRMRSPLCQELEKQGAAIFYTDEPSLFPEQVDKVVYTPAIPKHSALFVYAQERGFALQKRAALLGELSKSSRCLASAGTHGKTSTSSLLCYLLRVGGIDASAFLGGIALDLKSNFVWGASDVLVVEADEFDRSFLHLHPCIASISSSDADHLDIYGQAEALRASYSDFARQVQQRVYLGPQVDIEQEGLKAEVLRYGLAQGAEQAEALGLQVWAQNIRIEQGYFLFDYHRKGRKAIEGLRSSMPGRYNIENALAALSIALDMGIEEEFLRTALAGFQGVYRRFERLAEDASGRVFIDDYAHHPSELRAFLAAVHELYPGKRILGVFQPHLYSRTRDFLPEFAQALSVLDELILLDIYPAREEPIAGVQSQVLCEAVSLEKKSCLSKSEVVQRIEQGNYDVLLTMGAGDISAELGSWKEAFLHAEQALP